MEKSMRKALNYQVIVVPLTGGLGNQIFQFSFALHYSNLTKLPYALEESIARPRLTSGHASICELNLGDDPIITISANGKLSRLATKVYGWNLVNGINGRHSNFLYAEVLINYISSFVFYLATRFWARLHVLKGLGFINIGQLAEKFVQPISFLIFLLGFYLFGFLINDFFVVLFRTLSFVIAAIFILILISVCLKNVYRFKRVPIQTDLWKKSMVYFTLSTLLFTINSRVDIVFLGLYSIEPEKIAYYNVALKFSDIALIPFLVISFSCIYLHSKV
jgi:hypothetical protein